MTGRFIFCLSVMMVTGCSVVNSVSNYFASEDNAEPPAPLITFRQQLSVVKLWSKKTGSGTDKQYLKLAPIIARQRLYIADADGRLKAMDAINGGSIWSLDTDINITGGPGFGENTTLVGGNEGDVIAYNSDSGKKIWESTVSSEILSPPQRSENVVIVRTIDGKVFALNGTDGERLWIYDRSVPALTLRGTATPVITDGVVIAGFDGGRLAALELHTGKLLWETRITTARGSSELERMVDIDSTPLVIDGVIYVATFQGHVAAVQLETGRILWTRDISSYAGLAVDTKYIYVTDDDSHIQAYDRFTGTSLWKQKKLHARNVTAPAGIGDYLVVGDLEGYLHWMSKASGKFVARTRVSDERIIVSPITAGKFLYAYCSDGTLAAYTYR
ncbi:MAG: outer membrane protein assembly factor BamB [Gammaproteobacteria bacterium]